MEKNNNICGCVIYRNASECKGCIRLEAYRKAPEAEHKPFGAMCGFEELCPFRLYDK